MTQYVTLVSGWFVQGKSHILGPQSSQITIATVCGRRYSLYDDDVVVTDQPQCKGVCKLCLRRQS